MDPAIDELLAKLPDPNNVGSSEYRAIHEFLTDFAEGYERDDDERSPEEAIEDELNCLEDAIKSIRNQL